MKQKRKREGQKMDFTTIYALCCFFLPGATWMAVKGKGLGRSKQSALHVAWSLVFMLYGFLAVYVTAGIGTVWDLVANKGLDDSINLIPLAEMDWLGYILNIFMFMPLGFLLPLIWKSFRQARKTVLYGFLMSLSIEVCQLFCFRTTDIDDLIMNTVGAFFGFLCWKLLKRLFPQAGEQAMDSGKAEPWVYLFGGMMGIVLLYNWRLLY